MLNLSVLPTKKNQFAFCPKTLVNSRAMTLTQTPITPSIDIPRRWFIIDADGVPLGRIATMAADLLRGKGKTTFSPHQDQGDGVAVINAAKLVLTGKKLVQKIDFRASGYPGGQVFTKYGKMMETKPIKVIELAVYGMLPKNRLRDRFMRRLKVFRESEGAAIYKGAVVIDMKDNKNRRGGPFVYKVPAPQIHAEVAS